MNKDHSRGAQWQGLRLPPTHGRLGPVQERLIHGAKDTCSQTTVPGAHERLPRSDVFTASSWSFPQLLNWKNLTSEEAEKKNSPQGAQHCWAHTREPQPQRHTCPNAHYSTAGNIQDKEAAQMPVYGRMGKRCPHAYSGIALSQKRDKTGPSVETQMDPETATQ